MNNRFVNIQDFDGDIARKVSMTQGGQREQKPMVTEPRTIVESEDI